MQQVRAHSDGFDLTFHLTQDGCPIQGRHRVGKFYERADLDRLSDDIKPGAYVIDVGANIGNHALYFATLIGAGRVVAIEPNPQAITALRANVAQNGLEDVIDLSVLGIGLSDNTARDYGMQDCGRNLGAAQMQAGAGVIEVHRGDDLFAEDTPDLIKIDVEGMEMQVLSGFSQVIDSARPALFVEVDTANDAGCHDWRAAHHYAITFQSRHQAANVNYFAQPRADGGTL